MFLLTSLIAVLQLEMFNRIIIYYVNFNKILMKLLKNCEIQWRYFYKFTW